MTSYEFSILLCSPGVKKGQQKQNLDPCRSQESVSLTRMKATGSDMTNDAFLAKTNTQVTGLGHIFQH